MVQTSYSLPWIDYFDPVAVITLFFKNWGLKVSKLNPTLRAQNFLGVS